ncbi:MAG TPA: L,D-transpeptidase family protein [Allosphingosinicella sp.]|jgi:lipoprotein-anchoring transpeptidase ErfK/SrfK|nr:L,D-transpeptidase family protein [Allosphingosinicella sp.]
MNQVSVRNLFVAASVLLLAFTPVCSAYAGIVGPAAAAVDPAPAAVEQAVLSPGEFVWQPERSPQGEVEIVVSIPLQRAYVYRGGALIGVTTVSTGKPGHRTPTGKFDILEKRAKHFSSIYNNAPMPFMQRLTWGGIALHAGQIPGRPASHGCVRLPLEFARNLFGVTSRGGSVHIIDRSPAPQEALAMVRGNSAYTGMGGPLEPVEGTN